MYEVSVWDNGRWVAADVLLGRREAVKAVKYLTDAGLVAQMVRSA